MKNITSTNIQIGTIVCGATLPLLYLTFGPLALVGAIIVSGVALTLPCTVLGQRKEYASFAIGVVVLLWIFLLTVQRSGSPEYYWLSRMYIGAVFFCVMTGIALLQERIIAPSIMLIVLVLGITYFYVSHDQVAPERSSVKQVQTHEQNSKLLTHILLEQLDSIYKSQKK